MKIFRGAPLLVALVVVPAGAVAQTNATYTYDVFGRLVSAVVTGSPASSANTAIIDYDPAGNRLAVRSAGNAAAAAPVAKNPTFSFSSNATYSIAMAELASTSAAARITAFSPPSGGGSATIAGDGQSVSYTAPNLGTPGMCEPPEVVTISVPYTVQNRSGGRSGSGTATIRVRGPAGPKPSRGQQCP